MSKIDEQLLEWSKQFNEFKVPRWEELPDIDYYMDQVIEYINKNTGDFCQPNITSAMVNNYVKNKLVPPPIKKKYSKIHIAYLITITFAKNICSITQIKNAIELQMKVSGGRRAYNAFCQEIEQSLKNIVFIIKKENIIANNTKNIAIKSMCDGVANKILAVKIIEVSMNSIGDKE